MDIATFFINNLSLISANPTTFITFAVLIVGVTWIIFAYIHAQHITTLQERLSLKDEQIQYYKQITAAEQEKTPSLQSQTEQASNKPTIRDNVLSAIDRVSARDSATTSVRLFEELSKLHDFSSILFALLSMNKEGLVTWTNAPDMPDALAIISRIKPT